MNEETFLTAVRELAELPVPGPLAEQQILARGRAARRRRTTLRTATAAVGTALAVAAVIVLPSGRFTAAPPATSTPTATSSTAPSPAVSQPPLTNGDSFLTQWTKPAGSLSGDQDVLAGLRRRAWDVLYNGVAEPTGRPASWTGRKKPQVSPEEFGVLLAADVGSTRVALVRTPPVKHQFGTSTFLVWLAGRAGTAPVELLPYDCSTATFICPLPLAADGRLVRGFAQQPASMLVATLIGASVTADANDIGAQGAVRQVGPAVSATDVPGLFRIAAVPSVPFAITARRGGGRAQQVVGPAADPNAFYQDVVRQLQAAGVRSTGRFVDLRAAVDVNLLAGQTGQVLDATLLPQVPGRYKVLHASAHGARGIAVFAVQAPSGGWAVVPTQLEGVGRSSWFPVVDAAMVVPGGDVTARGFAWQSHWQKGHLQQQPTGDTVAVLGPVGAVSARVTGAAGEVALTLTGRYGEGVVRGARHVRFVDAAGTVVGEADVAPLLQRGRHLGP